MAAVVTKDVQWARRIVCSVDATLKRLAHRHERHVESVRLRILREEYEPLLKPRLTAWDIT